jgi:hypothetical protein
MKYSLLLLLLLFYFFSHSQAQTIPYGQCGLQYTYDAAGNVLSRDYICNNTPPGGRVGIIATTDGTTEKEQDQKSFVQQVEALYPNPTTGRFNVTFLQALDNAVIRILDINGRTYKHFKASGTQIQCDISGLPAGVYSIEIIDKSTVISKKVIKQ